MKVCWLLSISLISTGLIAGRVMAGSSDISISEAEARIALSRALKSDERIVEAIASYRELIERMPERSDLRIELAEIFDATGDVSEALDLLEPIDEASLGRRGRLLRANLAARQGNFDQAIAEVRLLIQAEPDDLQLQTRLADLLIWAKEYDAAVEVLEVLVRRQPDDIQLRRRLARTLDLAGRPGESIQHWKISLGEAPASR